MTGRWTYAKMVQEKHICSHFWIQTHTHTLINIQTAPVIITCNKHLVNKNLTPQHRSLGAHYSPM